MRWQMRNFQQVLFQYWIDWIFHCCWATNLICYYGVYHRDQVQGPLVKLFWSWNKVAYFQNCKYLSNFFMSKEIFQAWVAEIVIVLNTSLIRISEGRGKDLFYTGLPTSLWHLICMEVNSPCLIASSVSKEIRMSQFLLTQYCIILN